MTYNGWEVIKPSPTKSKQLMYIYYMRMKKDLALDDL